MIVIIELKYITIVNKIRIQSVPAQLEVSHNRPGVGWSVVALYGRGWGVDIGVVTEGRNKTQPQFLPIYS